MFPRPLVVPNTYLIPKNVIYKVAQPQRGDMFIDNRFSPRT